MAVYNSLGAAFTSKEDAQRFLEFFKSKTLILSNKKEIKLESELKQNKQGRFIVGVYPRGVSLGDPRGYSEPKLTEPPLIYEVEKFFIEALKEAPDFIYAQFGGEAHDFILTDEEYEDDLKDPDGPALNQVISKEFHKELGEPKGYEPFKDGYLWRPKA